MKPKHFILLLAFTISCRSSNNGLYSFDPTTLKENDIALSQIADDITYIPLDNSFPISLIYQPKYSINNSIYLSAINTGIMAFDKSGRFLRRIGNYGRGPGEYGTCFNFTVDETLESVYVLDNKTIKVYSRRGNFLRSIPLAENGEGVESIEILNSKIYLSYRPQYENVTNDWIILDTLGNLINSKQRTDRPFTVNWSMSGGMYKLDSRIYHWNPWRDTIFSILPDLSYEPSFLFAQWDNRVPREMINDPSQLKIINNPNLLFETRQFIVCRYKYDNRLLIALIDKKSDESYITELKSGPTKLGNNIIGGFLNDLDGGVRFLPENYFAENNREYMFCLIDAIELATLLKDSDFLNSKPLIPEKKKELESLASRIKETDNQILMIVRLKK
jgi:hypothetical protein